jgi:hypothetical protein
MTALWASEAKERVVVGLGNVPVDISNAANPVQLYVLAYNLAGKKEKCVAEDLGMTVVARCGFSTAWRAQFGRRYVIGAIPSPLPVGT